jgi:hypothetical protein
LALSRLGNYGDISDIDTPETDPEKVFSKWYDTIRKKTLKMLIPSFSFKRAIVAQLTTDPVFGWTQAFEYPADCLKLLGIGEVEEKTNDYAIEQLSDGKKAILTEQYNPDGSPSSLNIRYIKDEQDTTKFTDDFITLFSWELAYATCMEITQDLERLTYMEKILPMKRSEMGAVDSQENRPTRINNSKFLKARNAYDPRNDIKR